MRRRNRSALAHAADPAPLDLQAQRRAIRDSLRRGYREMGRLNLALAEEGLLFEDPAPLAPGLAARRRRERT